MTAAEEIIILDHLDIFKKNGFAFRVVEEVSSRAGCLLCYEIRTVQCLLFFFLKQLQAQPGQRLFLTAVPFSKRTQVVTRRGMGDSIGYNLCVGHVVPLHLVFP